MLKKEMLKQTENGDFHLRPPYSIYKLANIRRMAYETLFSLHNDNNNMDERRRIMEVCRRGETSERETVIIP